MCICVNCHYVDRCTTYHAVEELHQQPHLTDAPDFEPINPVINHNFSIPKVVITDDGQITQEGDFSEEYDVVGCDSFKLERGKWARLRPGELVPT